MKYSATRFLTLLFMFVLSLTSLQATDDSIDSLSDYLIRSLDAIDKNAVLAVLDIRNIDGRDSSLGNYLEEELAEVLFRRSGRTVVERSQLDQLMEEWNLALSGVIADETISDIGNAVGADVLLVGGITKMDNFIRAKLRLLDTESSVVLTAVEGDLPEKIYCAMYDEIVGEEELTEDDFFIGRGRAFEKTDAFLLAFSDLMNALSQIDGGDSVLDKSFLEYLQEKGDIHFTEGSRHNCTIRLKRTDFDPLNLYRYFFLEGQSPSVFFFDEDKYGWHTNPLFQRMVESEFSIAGVPEIYKAVMESEKRNVKEDSFPDPSFSDGIWGYGTGRSPEWAFLWALVDLAMLLETRLEIVVTNTPEGQIEFLTEFTGMDVLEEAKAGISDIEIKDEDSGFSASLRYGTY